MGSQWIEDRLDFIHKVCSNTLVTILGSTFQTRYTKRRFLTQLLLEESLSAGAYYALGVARGFSFWVVLN